MHVTYYKLSLSTVPVLFHYITLSYCIIVTCIFFSLKEKEVHRLVVTGNEICAHIPTSLKIQLLLCGIIMANFFMMFEGKDQKRPPKFSVDLLNIHVQLHTLEEKALLVSLPSNDKFLNHAAFQKLPLLLPLPVSFYIYYFFFVLHLLSVFCCLKRDFSPKTRHKKKWFQLSNKLLLFVNHVAPLEMHSHFPCLPPRTSAHGGDGLHSSSFVLLFFFPCRL